MIADIALPVSYDWFLLGTRLLIAAILLVFLWRVMIVVGRDALTMGIRRRPGFPGAARRDRPPGSRLPLVSPQAHDNRSGHDQ